MLKEKPCAPPVCGLCGDPSKCFAFAWGGSFAFGLLEGEIQDPDRSKGVEMSFMGQPAAFGTLKSTEVRGGCRPNGWLNGTKHMGDDRTILFG